MLLVFISVFPVIVILLYIYFRDKYEKEPIGLLLKAFVGGLFSALATILFLSPLHSFFPEFYSVHGMAFFRAFAGAAIPEEILKFAFLYFIIWNNRNFNENFDGIVYAVFVALGFACFENVLYVTEYGAGVGIMRGIFAVPGHALDGVIMGYYFSLARFKPAKSSGYLLKSVLYPVIAHGIYDFLLFYASGIAEENHFMAGLAIIAFLIFIVALWRAGFRKIKQHVETSVFKTTS